LGAACTTGDDAFHSVVCSCAGGDDAFQNVVGSACAGAGGGGEGVLYV